MIRIFTPLLIFSISILNVIGQKTIAVSIEDRNLAIRQTKEATAAIKNENYDIALDKLQKSIEKDSTYREAYLQLYQVGNKNLNNSEAIFQGLNKGKRIFEEDDELHFYCGEMYRLNSNFDSALIEYSNAIKYAKTNGEDFYLVPYYYLKRGNIYLKQEQYQLALNDYNYLLKLDPTSTSGLTNRGTTYFKLGEKDKACQDWNNAVNNGFVNANAYLKKYCKN